jgi:hypothetical protein
MGCLAWWNIAFQRSSRRKLREPVELRQVPAVASFNAAGKADSGVSLTDYADVWATGGGFVFSSVGVVPVAAVEAARPSSPPCRERCVECTSGSQP